MSAYLFVHFKEKTTPDAEQVYFGISRDGLHWQDVNEEQPVLWTYVGTHGVRDFTIVRHPQTGRTYIAATDLSIAYQSRQLRPGFWEKIGRIGSNSLVIWESDDLVHWSESRLADMTANGQVKFGCVWAPDAIWDEEKEAFMLHWSSPLASENFAKKRIMCAWTKDFKTFTIPKILHEAEQGDMIDSAVYKLDGAYYLFAKSDSVRMYRSEKIDGPYERVKAFDETVGDVIDGSRFEAPTGTLLNDGRWCLFLDFFGARGLDQGYVPFVSEVPASGVFRRSDESFSFPYGYKHGTILRITDEEYDRIAAFDWSDKGYGPGAF